MRRLSNLEDYGEEEVQADGDTALRKHQLHLLFARTRLPICIVGNIEAAAAPVSIVLSRPLRDKNE